MTIAGLSAMKLLLENLPSSLASQCETLRRCLVAMDAALPIQQVILFGSHARGEAGPESDIDLCLVSAGAGRQLEAARQWRQATRDIWPIPAFTLLPISPERLAEKRANGDYFFQTVLTEGVPLATQD
jgi:predicted nucleotidyltransferase